MFRNYIITALRNLVRNRLYAAINIVGLAVGFAAALLIALFVRDEFSFDTWIPDHADVYHITTKRELSGQRLVFSDQVSPNLASFLKSESPAIQEVARLLDPNVRAGAQPILRKGEVEGREDLFWADPNFFDVLPLPVVAGDLRTALSAPDGIVLTRALARKYFGRDDPIGGIIELDRKFPMRVMAVLKDLPPETHLRFSVLASGLASISPQTSFKVTPPDEHNYIDTAHTYVRVRPGTVAAELQRALRGAAARSNITFQGLGIVNSYEATPISAMHVRAGDPEGMKPSSSPDSLIALSSVGLLIVVVAGINFVNLMTARAIRRAVEVGIRKVSGAERRDLIIQFIGEAAIYALIGMAAALTLAALLLPSLNAFLGRAMAMRFSPGEAASVTVAILAFGIAAGFYPGFVLSAFRPARVLAGGRQQNFGSGRGQRILVSLQFSVLVGLVLTGGIIWRQTAYGMKEGLRLNTDAIVVVEAGGCVPAFQEEVRRLAGVRAAACASNGAPLSWGMGVNASRPGGNEITAAVALIDFGLLEMYGLKPVSGRFFDRRYGTDAVPADDKGFSPRVVISETAARDLGFESPAAAIGQSIHWIFDEPDQIIGVAPDFRSATGSIRSSADPVIFVIAPTVLQQNQVFAGQNQLHIKLDGQRLPETLDAIDGLWKAIGQPRPISRFFVDAKVQETYAQVTRQAQIFGIFAGIALFVACLGLFGLSAFTAERRTKEIGIRKAMGASKMDILRLLLWQFTKPVLWANVIAWPAAYFIMRRWLEGFAYHVDLEPWMFLAASTLALVIALATVAGHALLVARAKPVAALRYE